MPLIVCSRGPTRVLTLGLHPRRDSEKALGVTGLSALSLASITIENPGATEGLRAKLGRFFSFSSSTSPSAVKSRKEISKSFHSARPRDSTGGGRMQTLYLSHGSPMLPLQHDDPSRQFIARLGSQIERPKAIVIVSSHWDSIEPTVTAGKINETIYDFYGFPKELYKLTYNAPGDPELAQRVVDLLKQGGFPKAKKDERRGLDHGAWVPLMLMYPEKDIPIVELSVQCRKDGAHHYKVGQALASLKNEGVLVIGSGTATHNLRDINVDGGPVVPWALAFDNWLNDAFCNNRYEAMIDYREKAPYARRAHPTPDHFLPAIVALGAAGQDAVGERIHSEWVLGTLSMASYSLKSPPSVTASA